MPMVSATDIPYRGFPEGRTSPQAPSDYQQIPTSPQMFGSIGAEALQQAGQQGEKLATEIARIGAYQQHYLDRTEEDKLSSQLDDAAHARKYGDPTAGLDANGNPLVPGFKNRYGSDAIDYIKSGQPSKDFNDDVARIAASASNDRVREMFLRQSRARRTAFDTSLDEHWTSQLAVHADDARKARNIGINRDLAVGYNDDSTVQSLVHDKIALYVRDEKDPVIAGGKYFLAVHDAAKELIDAGIADNNAPRAMEIFNAYKEHMSGSDRLSLWNVVKPAFDKQLGDQRFLSASRPGGGGGAPSVSAADHYNQAIALGASPNEAALLTSAADAESGFDPTKSHDGGIGYGLYGHNDTRLAAMQQQFGPRPTAAQQIQFALNELRSRPEGARVNAAKTPQELTALQFEFEQPKRGPTDQADRRLATTREYMTNPPKAPAVAGVIANPPTGGADVIERALKVSGQRENSAALAKYLHDGGVDMDPKTVLWCAGFVNATLAQTGQRGTGSLVATSFLKWGKPVANPADVQRGDVAVVAEGLPAGALGGHVGFATGNKRADPDTGKPQIEVLAGNERVDLNDPKAGHLVDTRWRDADTLTLRRAPGAGAGAASAFQKGAQAAATVAPSAPGPAPAGVPRAAVAPGAGDQIDSAGGDSISAQQANSPGVAVIVDKSKANGPIGTGTARVGDNPESVRKRLEALSPGTLKGNFMLSTGASNTMNRDKVADLKQFDAIPAQIAASKKAGAERVVIPGVGPGVANQAEANARLKQIADQNGAIFVMPDIGWQLDGIHPANHRELRAKVGAALGGGTGRAPAPKPPGLVEPGNIDLNPPPA